MTCTLWYTVPVLTDTHIHIYIYMYIYITCTYPRIHTHAYIQTYRLILGVCSSKLIYIYIYIYIFRIHQQEAMQSQSHEAIVLHRALFLASSYLPVGASVAASAIHDTFAPDRLYVRSADFTCRKSWQRVLQSSKGHGGSAMQAVGWMPRGPL